VTCDLRPISSKPPRGAARDGRIDRNGTVDSISLQYPTEERNRGIENLTQILYWKEMKPHFEYVRCESGDPVCANGNEDTGYFDKFDTKIWIKMKL